MKKIILLCAMFFVSPIIFAQNDKYNKCEVYIYRPDSYWEFRIGFMIVKNGLVVDNPTFLIKYNKKGLKKIINGRLVPYNGSNISYTNGGNIYLNMRKKECYSSDNFDDTKLWKPIELFLMACPNFFEMTNEERLQYFLEHMEK